MKAMKPEPEHLTVIVDSREQHPLKLGMPCKRHQSQSLRIDKLNFSDMLQSV